MKYTNKNVRRKLFQFHLRILLIKVGIRHDWGDISDKKEKPDWIKKLAPLQCKCINYNVQVYEGCWKGFGHEGEEYCKNMEKSRAAARNK